MRLISDFLTIEQLTGVNPYEHVLMPPCTFDAPKDISPALIAHNNGYYLIALGFEEGNFAEAGVAHSVVQNSNIKMLYYQPYFTWDTIEQDRLMAKDDGSALAKIEKEGSLLEVDSDLPLERFRRFSAHFKTEVNAWDEPENYYVYEVPKEEVIATFAAGREEAKETASRLLANLTSLSREELDTVSQIMEAAVDNRFEKLDEMMGGQGIQALLVSSPLNVQELTGLPWEAINNSIMAIYEGTRTLILSQTEIDVPGSNRLGAYGNLNQIIEKLIGKSIVGIEERNIPIGRYKYLTCNKQDAGNMLRFWREKLSAYYLPNFVVAIQATRYSMEKAISLLSLKIDQGESMTEKELGAEVEKLFAEFQQKHNLPMKLSTSHLSINSGIRTPRPALPSDFQITSSSRSVKIDTGVKVFFHDHLMAISDMARTMVFSKEAEEMQELLDKSMLKVAIPACRAGRTGADVHQIGMNLLLEKMDRIREIEMITEGVDFSAVYTRNIGHLLGGKQQQTVIFFTPAHKEFKLEEGMIGCVEYQWPIAGHSIGSEDMFLVTESKGINLTR